ncbi:MAG: hypothetical protein IPM98_02920 [Lewinellaceae bacterium]|nr:hypothetical protein [Lewinellaceae bacterium]
METIRLVLNMPFMRYPAGTVFELEDSNEFSGWEDDERLREKLNFSDKRVYHLPDGGRGFATSLPAYDTSPLPLMAFEGIDLRTGPCRITKVQSGLGTEMLPSEAPLPCGQMRDDNAGLASINDNAAQGIMLKLPEEGKNPREMVLRDVLRGQELRRYSDFDAAMPLDFSDLGPGFYQLLLAYKNDCVHSIRFIKSFPLLILPERGSSRFKTLKTMY